MADRFYRVDLGAGFPDRITEGSAQSWCGKGGGLVLLVLVAGGCTEWTIPPCAVTYKTPCVGPCTVAVDPVGPRNTRVTVPLAVVIQDENGMRHCQQIQP